MTRRVASLGFDDVQALDRFGPVENVRLRRVSRPSAQQRASGAPAFLRVRRNRANRRLSASDKPAALKAVAQSIGTEANMSSAAPLDDAPG